MHKVNHAFYVCVSSAVLSEFMQVQQCFLSMCKINHVFFQEEKGQQFFYDMKAGPEQRSKKRGRGGGGERNRGRGRDEEHHGKKPKTDGKC